MVKSRTVRIHDPITIFHDENTYVVPEKLFQEATSVNFHIRKTVRTLESFKKGIGVVPEEAALLDIMVKLQKIQNRIEEWAEDVRNNEIREGYPDLGSPSETVKKDAS